jgi:hypothetical protein
MVMCGADEARLADRVVDISTGGARIQTPAPLPVNTKQSFFFTVPDARFRDVVVKVPVTVVWSSGPNMGVSFDERVGGIEDYVGRLERLEQLF